MESQSYFNSVASQWDQMRQGFYAEALREKAIKVSNIKRGLTAVDVGAGTGFITDVLIQEGVKVIAVDQSEKMLEIIRNKFGFTDKLECVIGDAENLPIGPASVDNVFANMCLHHVENPAAGIREMVRILKPGGLLVITDLDEHGYDFLQTEHKDRWLGFKRDTIY